MTGPSNINANHRPSAHGRAAGQQRHSAVGMIMPLCGADQCQPSRLPVGEEVNIVCEIERWAGAGVMTDQTKTRCGYGGRAGRVEPLTGIEGASRPPVRKIVLLDG